MNTSGSNWSENNAAEQLGGNKFIYAQRLRTVDEAFLNSYPVLAYQVAQESTPAKEYPENHPAEAAHFETPANAEVNYRTPAEAPTPAPELTDMRAIEQAARQDLEDIYGVSQ